MMTNMKERPEKSTTDLRRWAAIAMQVAEHAPERLSLSQATVFILIALADARGDHVTLKDIKTAAGSKLAPNIHTSYRIFIEPNRAYPQALGWVERRPNPDDEREQFLTLSAKGRRVLAPVLT